MSYCHLTTRERMVLFYLSQYGCSLREIGRRMNRSHSTISRELERNARICNMVYCDRAAQSYANKRKCIARHQKAFDNQLLRSYVYEKLEIKWSPEIISARIKTDYPRNKSMRISAETVYQWLYKQAAQGGMRYQQLIRTHKKRQKRYKYGRCRGAIANRTGIEQRPVGANQRYRYGHWEGDTMVGCRQRGRIDTHVERKSRYLMANLIHSGKAALFNQASIESYEHIPQKYRRTLTLDNGSENAQHQKLSKQLNMDIYFAAPYSSWQRGTNENTNGLIRRYFPKGTNFLTITKKQLEKVVEILNHRPRKCLNYQTPFEVFNKVTDGALGT